MLRWFPVALCLGAAVGGCSDRPDRVVGEECDLSADCRAPLVCRIGACREECREVRDCRPGTICVRDAEGYGVCQLEDEGGCALASDCPEGLVCRFGECTNMCTSDRDCVNGLICAPDPDMGMRLACLDTASAECRLNSDCPPDLVCARDLRCREECREDRDCRDGRVCDPSSSPRICAVAMPLPRPPPPPTFGTGGRTTCVIGGTTLTCFGSNAGGQVGVDMLGPAVPPNDVLSGSPIADVSLGDNHACAITDRLRCWGLGTEGQLGVSDTFTTSPIDVPISGALGVALGYEHTCAWSATGAWCWGRNDLGQLGDGTMDSRFTTGPSIDIGGPVVHMGCGEVHTCAIRDDGAVYCWGRNVHGELGDETTTSSAVPVASVLNDGVAVAGGRRHTCALLADATVRCFGENVDGQLGDGDPTARELTPVEPIGLGRVIQITVGQRHTCALEATGTVKCFGHGADGQLGSDVGPLSAVPVAVPLPMPVTEVRAGDLFTCARAGDGSAYCFGENGATQFGDSGSGGAPRSVTW